MDERVRLEYERWLGFEGLDRELREELEGIAGQDEEIRERFYEDIKFGTGGIRGIIGAGTSRMNLYTVAKATQGLAAAVLAATAGKSDRPASFGAEVRATEQDVSQVASQAASQVVKQDAPAPPAVVIAYDCRHKSRFFAELAAGVLAANGIKAYVFEELTPTPILSFAVRDLGAAAGIVITASHNPPTYNGYKAYWSDGAQVATEIAEDIMAQIESVADIFNVPRLSVTQAAEQGLLEWLSADGAVMRSYYARVHGLLETGQPSVQYAAQGVDHAVVHDAAQAAIQAATHAVEADAAQIRIIYTPLHGVAYRPMVQVMNAAGYGPDQLILVGEQTVPDPNFSTVKSPNPEEPSAYELALGYAVRHDADIIIATDPDGDRLGVMAKVNPGQAARSADDYRLISGNQLGALLFDRILSLRLPEVKAQVEKNLGAGLATNSPMRSDQPAPQPAAIDSAVDINLPAAIDSLPVSGIPATYPNGYMIKTIVTSDLTGVMARAHGIYAEDTLTGFKHIAERVEHFNTKIYPTADYPAAYVFGFEESFGYMPADFVRDKDGIQSALLAVELAKHYKKSGRGLWQALEDIYQTYGYYQDALINVVLEGIAGQDRIAAMMNESRTNPLTEVAGIQVDYIVDYLNDETGIPVSNVLKYYLVDGSWFAMRPSGTEPKLKFYFSTNDPDQAVSQAKLEKLVQAVKKHFQL